MRTGVLDQFVRLPERHLGELALAHDRRRRARADRAVVVVEVEQAVERDGIGIERDAGARHVGGEQLAELGAGGGLVTVGSVLAVVDDLDKSELERFV